jgi:hypothetical protein
MQASDGPNGGRCRQNRRGAAASIVHHVSRRRSIVAANPWRHGSVHTDATRWFLTAFVSGALAVLIFHQAAIAMLHATGLTASAPFSMARTAPWGVPAIWSIAFWGGAWGVILAATVRRLDGPALVSASVLFGAILPTLVAWFVVAPLKGRPMAAGFVPAAMMVGVIANAAWGLGTGIGLVLFGRSHIRKPLAS